MKLIDDIINKAKSRESKASVLIILIYAVPYMVSGYILNIVPIVGFFLFVFTFLCNFLFFLKTLKVENEPKNTQ